MATAWGTRPSTARPQQRMALHSAPTARPAHGHCFPQATGPRAVLIVTGLACGSGCRLYSDAGPGSINRPGTLSCLPAVGTDPAPPRGSDAQLMRTTVLHLSRGSGHHMQSDGPDCNARFTLGRSRALGQSRVHSRQSLRSSRRTAERVIHALLTCCVTMLLI